jgi:hypothetical protein
MDNVQLTEETFIFGEVGQAIYRQGDKYFKVSRRKHTPEACRVGEINLLLDVCAEPLHLPYVPPLPELLEQLRQSYAKYTALQFLLNGLDKTLGEELQRECIGHLDKLFKDEAVYQFVRQRFLSRPLPKEADVSHAIQYAKTAKVKELYQEALAKRQEVQEVVDKPKQSIKSPPDLNESEQAKKMNKSMEILDNINPIKKYIDNADPIKKYIDNADPIKKYIDNDPIKKYIDAISSMREKNWDDAVSSLKRGVHDAPVESRNHFRSALAFAQLRQQRWEDALDTLREVKPSPLEQPLVQLLEAEVYAEQALATTDPRRQKRYQRRAEQQLKAVQASQELTEQSQRVVKQFVESYQLSKGKPISKITLEQQKSVDDAMFDALLAA